MALQIFGTKKSFDTKKAERWFKERSIPFQFIDLIEKPMSAGEFESVITFMAKTAGSRCNAVESLIDVTHKNAADIMYLDDSQKESYLFEHQNLFTTPIVRNTGDKSATAGYQSDIWKTWKLQ